MKSFFLAIFIVSAISLQASAKGSFFADNQIDFKFQSLLEPYEVMDCIHKRREQRPQDWVVFCTNGRITYSFDVHLVVNYYPMTSEKMPAYEVLYWVYNRNSRNHSANSSSTSWHYLNSKDSRINLMQVSQGILNDEAYLKLQLRL
jgi:hypothetical protein